MERLNIKKKRIFRRLSGSGRSKYLFALLLLSIIVADYCFAKPTAVIYVGSKQNVGYIVCFDGSQSTGTNPMGDEGDIFGIKTYIWNFGDGAGIQSGEYFNTITHVYNTQGTYTVSLKVVDYNGESDQTSTSITVGTLPKVTVSGNSGSAISSAISSLNGEPGIVNIPAGNYNVSSTINIPSGIIIEGAGMDKTIIHGSPSFIFNITGNNVRLTGIQCSGNDSNRGIYINKKINFYEDHCDLHDFYYAHHIVYGASATFEYNKIYSCDKGDGYGMSPTSGSYIMVRYNEFSQTRHCIAGGGIDHTLANTGYDFLYNHVQYDNQVQYIDCAVDMHPAGHGRVRISDNIFEDLHYVIGLKDSWGEIKRNIFRNVSNYVMKLGTPEHNGEWVQDAGTFNCHIDNNTFINCGTRYRIMYGSNIYINCREIDDLIPFEGSANWNDCNSTLTITTSFLPDGQVEQSYNTSLQASNGNPPYEWSIIGGDLPDGLNLSNDGIISGTPIQEERKAFTVQVTDANDSTASNLLTIEIIALPSLFITTSSLINGIIGEEYKVTLQASNGITPYVWSLVSGNLPAGLILNPNGVISGIPVQIGQNSFTAQVKDANHSTANKTLSITINASQESDFNAIQTERVTIDCNLSEFVSANSISLVDNSGRGSNRDNSAIARIMWDNANLYVGVEVTDTELNAVATENDNIGDLWKDDCIEIFIDPDNDGGNSMKSDDYRYTVNLNENVLDGNGFNGWNWDGNIAQKVSLNGTLNNNSDTDIGYIIEVAIPWNDLEILPIASKVLGLQLGISDRDAVGGYEYFGWPITNSSFDNPDKWGKVKLLENTSQWTAMISLSDPSPTKSGSYTVTLITSSNVIKAPTPLIFKESDGTTTTIKLNGSVPGTVFNGKFVVNSKIADGIGNFFLQTGALVFENGYISNTISSGATIRIDKTPPIKPQEFNGINED